MGKKYTNRVIDRTDSYLLVEDNQGRTFKISPEDEELVLINNTSWSVSRDGYVSTHNMEGKTRTYLHRFIMGPASGTSKHINHISHDPTDNTRGNLSPGNRSRRRGGTSKYKGVFWYTRRGKWMSKIMIGSKQKYLGYFDVEEDAARAYNKAAEEFFGDSKLLNVIPKT